MSDLDGTLKVTKPVSVWNRAIGVNFRNLFKSLTAIALGAATFKSADVAKGAVDALTSFRLKQRELGEVAYLLIFQALNRAMTEIARETMFHVTSAPVDEAGILERLDFSMENRDLTIDDTFFNSPQQISLLKDLKELFGQWLMNLGLQEARASTVAGRLDSYFIYALDTEWREHSDIYGRLTSALISPFTAAANQERAWDSYTWALEKQLHAPLLGTETFDLTHTYVELRGYYEKDAENDDTTDLLDAARLRGGSRRIRTVVDAHEKLEHWVKTADKNDTLKIVTGGPGSGKSCLSKVLAARLARSGSVRVLHIPLYMFNMAADLVESVGRYLRRTGYFPDNPLEVTQPSRRLLIFDGIDELPIQGKLAMENATQFIRAVTNALLQLNAQEIRVLVLITGRTIVIQANEAELRRKRQVLHLLPYSSVRDETERKTSYEDPLGLLAKDQRDEWWGKYREATGRPVGGMPDELKQVGRRLDEITAQPLLNYLVALSWDRAKVSFTKETNINEMYEDLAKGVYERVPPRGDGSAAVHPLIKNLQYEDFMAYLQEIAVCAWHGEGRTASIGEIERQCERSGCTPLTELFSEEAKGGALRLMTGFYFSKTGTRVREEELFEFTHKTFQEFLVARRFVEEIKVLKKRLDLSQTDRSHRFTESGALVQWAELCGPKAVDFDQFDFLKDQMSLLSKEEAEGLQKMLCRLIEHDLVHGMDMDRIKAAGTFKDKVEQWQNAEEALLAALSCCADRTGLLSEIEWPDEGAAGRWIHALNYRLNPNRPISARCLGRLDFTHIAAAPPAHRKKLERGAETSLGPDLRFVSLPFVRLVKANLEGADLIGANLIGADLIGANLIGANLIGADLQRADLIGANLIGADLQGANLIEANLGGALYNESTIFPESFDPEARNMRLFK